MTKPWTNERAVSRAIRFTRIFTVATVLALSASGSPVETRVLGVDSSRGGAIYLEADGRTVRDFAGFINIALDGVLHEAICVDIFTSIGLETISVNPFSPFAVTNAARASWLYATQFDLINSILAGEALQLAVWDIIHDGGDGFSAGHIRANTSIGTPTGVLTAANQYLTMSAGKTSGAASVYISVDGPAARQSLLSSNIGGTVWAPPLYRAEPVPEPAGLALGGLGVASLGLGLYLKKKYSPNA